MYWFNVSLAVTSVLVKGEKSFKDILKVRIDQKVFFTTLPAEILFEVGANPEALKSRLELEDGRSVEAPVYSVVLMAQDREDVTLAVTYEGAKPVLGAKFLEDFGFRLDSTSGSLESARHRGFAYNHES